MSFLWTPAATDPTVWLDADDSDTITLISDRVSQWNDKSGNGKHATQTTADFRPSVLTEELNGRDVIDLDGTNDRLDLPSLGISGSQSRSVFMVARHDTTQGSVRFFKQDVAGGTNTKAFRWGPNSSGNLRVEIQGSGWDSTHTVSGQGANIFGIVLGGTTLASAALYKNGNAQVASGTTTLDTNDTENQLGGSANAASPEYLDGAYAEVLIFDYAVSSDLRETIEGYLAHRWGLASLLDSGHPYKTDAPTLETRKITITDLKAPNEANAQIANATDVQAKLWIDKTDTGEPDVVVTDATITGGVLEVVFQSSAAAETPVLGVAKWILNEGTTDEEILFFPIEAVVEDD